MIRMLMITGAKNLFLLGLNISATVINGHITKSTNLLYSGLGAVMAQWLKLWSADH